MEHAIVLVWRKLKIYGILQNILFILLESKIYKNKIRKCFPLLFFFFFLLIDLRVLTLFFYLVLTLLGCVKFRNNIC